MAKIKAQMKGEDRVVTGLVRFSFPYLFEKRMNDDGTPGKYELCVLIPKDDQDTINCINKAIEAAKARGKNSKWDGKIPSKLTLPLHDGDDKDGLDGFDNVMYLNARSATRPNVVDRNFAKILDPDDVQAGDYGIVALSFFPYVSSGNKGVGVCLDNVMWIKEGEHFSGKPEADTDFAGIDVEDVDDDDL